MFLPCLVAATGFAASAATAVDTLLLLVPLVEGAAIDPEILGHCDIAGDFNTALIRELRKVATPAPVPLAAMQDRALKVEIDDAPWGGNWFIEHTQTLRAVRKRHPRVRFQRRHDGAGRWPDQRLFPDECEFPRADLAYQALAPEPGRLRTDRTERLTR